MSTSTEKRCIFCGGHGRMTDEHIWGRWVKRYIRPTVNKHHFFEIKIPIPGRHVAAPPVLRAGHPSNATVSVVCRNCNGGWMSKIQNEAKPHLIPLFLGDTTILSTPSQRAISFWIAMATMTGEHLARSHTQVAISQDERKALMSGSLPRGWRIWIGQLRKPDWPRQWVHATWHLSDSEDAPPGEFGHNYLPNTQTTTFSIGKLFAAVFSSQYDDLTGVWNWPTAYNAGVRLQQIWPSGEHEFRWPKYTLTHTAASSVSDALVSYADDFGGRHFNKS